MVEEEPGVREPESVGQALMPLIMVQSSSLAKISLEYVGERNNLPLRVVPLQG